MNLPIKHTFTNGQTLEIMAGDLTEEKTEAIVNAANTHLKHGGGIAGFIVSKGGQIIQEESNQWLAKYGPITHTKPAVTGPGKLPCKTIIHAAGPIWGSGDEDQKLFDTLIGSLQCADSLGLQSIAFPAISTGVYRFPKKQAAEINFDAFQQYFEKLQPDSGIKTVKLVLYGQDTIHAFLEAWSERKRTQI